MRPYTTYSERIQHQTFVWNSSNGDNHTRNTPERSTRYLHLRTKRCRTWSWKINRHCKFCKSVSVWAIRSTRRASAKIFRTLSQKYRNFLGIWLRSEFVQIQLHQQALIAANNWLLKNIRCYADQHRTDTSKLSPWSVRKMLNRIRMTQWTLGCFNLMT